MSQWCRSTLCGHPLPTLTDSWTHSAASRHTSAPISHASHSTCSCSYYSFPVPLRVGGWVGLRHSRLATCSRSLAVDRVWVEPTTSRLRVWYSTTAPTYPQCQWIPATSACWYLAFSANGKNHICVKARLSFYPSASCVRQRLFHCPMPAWTHLQGRRV